MKGIVAAFAHGKVDIRERMGHFMEADILPVGVIGEFPEKVSPGQIDALFADVSFERHIVETVAVFVLYNINGLEIVQLKMIEAEGELYSGGADEQGHSFFPLDIDIFEVFPFDEQEYPPEEAVPAFHVEAAIIGVIAGQQLIEILVTGIDEQVHIAPSEAEPGEFAASKPGKSSVAQRDTQQQQGHEQSGRDKAQHMGYIVEHPIENTCFSWF